MTPMCRMLIAAALCVIQIGVPQPVQAEGRVLIFAAASTREAVLAVADLARKKLSVEVVASFAGSASLARQIEAGAPADMFLSANAAWMDRLAKDGLVDIETRRDLVRNRLVVIAPKDTAMPHIPDPLTGDADLGGALDGGRLALAEPGSVPAGIYAKEALVSLGLWDTVSARLAPAADVRGALALVERSNTPLGIVYATDARASAGVSVVSSVPYETHRPIVYPIALTMTGAENLDAGRLLDLFLSLDGQSAFASRGFEPAAP